MSAFAGLIGCFFFSFFFRFFAFIGLVFVSLSLSLSFVAAIKAIILPKDFKKKKKNVFANLIRYQSCFSLAELEGCLIEECPSLMLPYPIRLISSPSSHQGPRIRDFERGRGQKKRLRRRRSGYKCFES